MPAPSLRVTSPLRAVPPAVRAAVGVALVVLLIASLAVPATADPEAERFRQDIRELEAEQARVRAEADRLEAEQQKVRAEQRRLDRKLQEATDRLAQLEAEFAELSDAANETAREVATLANRQVTHRSQLGDRARALYQLGGVDPLLMMLGGESSDDMVDTAHYVAAISNKDQTTIEGFQADTTRLGRLQADLIEDREEVAAKAEEVEAARAALDKALAEAVAVEERLVELEEQAKANLAKLEAEERERREQERQRLAEIERRRREEAARRAAEEAARKKAAEEAARKQAQQAAAAKAASAKRAAPARKASPSASSGSSGGGSSAPAPSGGARACPQAHPRSFTNDWGAPRSGGRSHQGTDIFGRYGGPVHAITSGTIQFTKVGGRSGLFLSLRGDDGHSYWYMHLSGFAASPGQRVGAGQVIGYNGDSGNAKGTTPHIHFEYHPGGGGPVNPYPLLRSVC